MPHIILSGGAKIPITRKEYEHLIDQRFFSDIPRRFGDTENPTIVAGLHIAAILPTDIDVKSAQSKTKRVSNKKTTNNIKEHLDSHPLVPGKQSSGSKTYEIGRL